MCRLDNSCFQSLTGDVLARPAGKTFAGIEIAQTPNDLCDKNSDLDLQIPLKFKLKVENIGADLLHDPLARLF